MGSNRIGAGTALVASAGLPAGALEDGLPVSGGEGRVWVAVAG
jgi:hypothetical protein